MAELHPLEARDRDLLEHKGLQGGTKSVVTQIQALQPLEVTEHLLEGAEPVVGDVQVT